MIFRYLLVFRGVFATRQIDFVLYFNAINSKELHIKYIVVILFHEIPDCSGVSENASKTAILQIEKAWFFQCM